MYYSSTRLWSIFTSLSKLPRLNAADWSNVKVAGIAHNIVHRGCKAGRNKPRTIRTLTGIRRNGKDHQNLNLGHFLDSTPLNMQISNKEVNANSLGESSKTLRSITALCYKFHRQLEILHYASLTGFDLDSAVNNRVLQNVKISKPNPSRPRIIPR